MFCLAKSKKGLIIIVLHNNTFSPFRKLKLPYLYALSFISLVVSILLIATTNVYSAQVTLVWKANTEPELAGYQIYSGPSSRNYDNVNVVGNKTSYTLQNLVEGQTYYVAVTAYSTFNNESGYSEELVYTVPILGITHTIATTITAGDMNGNGKDEVIIDYGTGKGIGIQMDNDTVVQLHKLSPETITTCDIDGGGQDDIIVDFGPDNGIWSFMNNSTWVQQLTLSPESMITGDINGDGQDDIIVDLVDLGTWVRMNDSIWIQLHTLSPLTMITGDIDGNVQDDVIVDFGKAGLWVHMNNST